MMQDMININMKHVVSKGNHTNIGQARVAVLSRENNINNRSLKRHKLLH